MIIFLVLLFLVILPIIVGVSAFPFYICKDILGVQEKNSFDLSKGSCFNFKSQHKGGYEIKNVEITANDGVKLCGEYHDTGAKKTVIFFHGYRSNPKRDFDGIARDFLDSGYNLLFCFMRTHGISGGKRVGFGIVEQYDVLKWIYHVERFTETEQIVLYGFSMGGASVAYATNKIYSDKVKAVVLENAYFSFSNIGVNIASNKFFVLLYKTVLAVSKKFFRVDLKMSTENSLKENKIPTLFLGAREDKTVNIEQVQQSYKVNASKKELVINESATHGTATKIDAEEIKKKIFNFIKNEEK